MGNCVELYRAQKAKKVDKVIDKVSVGMDKRVEKLELLKQKYAGLAKKWDIQIKTLQKSLRGKKLTDEQKKTIVLLYQRRLAMARQSQKYGAMAFVSEQSKMGIDELKVNSELIEDGKTLTDGLHDLKNLGVDVSSAERQMDKTNDAKESIEDFNRAVAEMTQESNSFTADDMDTILQEIDDEFNDTPNMLKTMPVATKQQNTNYAKLNDPEEITDDSNGAEVSVEMLMRDDA
jgi:hypothetical protein